MKESLFSKEINRTFGSFSPKSMHIYNYLDISNRPYESEIRTVLEHWFEHYPDDKKKDFVGSFRSSDNGFYSKFFELYLYILFRKLNHKEIVIEKEFNDKTPDFTLLDQDNNIAIVEATTVFSDGLDSSQRKNMNGYLSNRIQDEINKEIKSDNFFLSYDYEGPPLLNPEPSLKWLIDSISNWLANLKEPEVKAFTLNKTNIKITLKANLISSSSKDLIRKSGRIIHLWGLSGGLLDSGDIKKSLRKKASKYRDLKCPYVIAINSMNYPLDKITEMEILFGSEQFTYWEGMPSGSKPEFSRKPDGLWHTPKERQYENVSGVIFGYNITPWSYHDRSVKLYLNPDSKYPLVGKLLELDRVLLIDNKMVDVPGKNPYKLLGT